MSQKISALFEAPAERRALALFEKALAFRPGTTWNFFYYWDRADHHLAQQGFYLYTKNQEWRLETPLAPRAPVSDWKTVSVCLGGAPTHFDLAENMLQRRLARYSRVAEETRSGIEPISGLNVQLQTTDFSSWEDWFGTLGTSARQLKTVMFSREVETSDQAQEANYSIRNLAKQYGLQPSASVNYGQKSLEWFFPEVYQRIQKALVARRMMNFPVPGTQPSQEVGTLVG